MCTQLPNGDCLIHPWMLSSLLFSRWGMFDSYHSYYYCYHFTRKGDGGKWTYVPRKTRKETWKKNRKNNYLVMDSLDVIGRVFFGIVIEYKRDRIQRRTAFVMNCSSLQFNRRGTACWAIWSSSSSTASCLWYKNCRPNSSTITPISSATFPSYPLWMNLIHTCGEP